MKVLPLLFLGSLGIPILLLILMPAAYAEVTAGLFTIDASCANPEVYARAANAVSARMGSCLAGINHEVAEDVAQFRAHKTKIRIICAPREAGKSSECAHASHGYPEIVLTRAVDPTPSNDCGNLQNTIFHEFLHIATSLTLKKAGIGWFGCKTCVTDERAADRICSSLPVTFDTAFQSCKPRGYN